MINSYNITPQTLQTDELLVFSNNHVLTGCTVTHASGTTSFQLNKPGFYYVSFNGVATTADAAGVVGVQLMANGVEVPGASAENYSEAAVNIRNLAFATIVKVLPSCASIDNTTILTIQNTGVEATFSNANINITKLC